MEKIRKYVEKFFNGSKCNPHYRIKATEMIDVMNEIILSGDANSSLLIICTLFDYGYAKGYRAAIAEMKKGGAA